MQPAKEPLLSGGAPTTVSSSGRFLSEPFYREKLAGFRKYDPELWRPTIYVHMCPFMTIPLTALVGWTFVLLCFCNWSPAFKAVFSLSPQVHTLHQVQ